MSLDSLLIPFRDLFTAPTVDEVAERAPLHERLRVTDDYLRVYQTGMLGLDLAQELPVDDAKKSEVPRWAWDISIWGRADAVDVDGEFPAVLGSVFYLIGATYSGSCIVQVSRGSHRGKLATIPDAATGSYKYKECSVPKAAIEDDAAADAYLAQIESENVFRLRPLTLEQFAELRLANAVRR